MTAVLTDATKKALAKYEVNEQHVSDLLEQREAEVLAMYLLELDAVEAGTPDVINDTKLVGPCNELLTKAKVAAKALDEARARRVRPLITEKRNVDELYSRPIDKLVALARKLQEGLWKWQQAEQRRIEAEKAAAAQAALEAQQKAAEAEARAAEATNAIERDAALAEVEQAQQTMDRVEMTTERLAASAPGAVKTDSGTTSLGTEWAHRIINPELVPREYCEPSDKRLRAAVTLGKREIPGVEIRERPKTRTVTRGR